MKIENGFVKIAGSSDLEDSSMAVGLCAIIQYPFSEVVDIMKYIKPDGKYQRCDNSKYLFSRDQTLCLVAGLNACGYKSFASLDRVDGKDIFSPANKGHIKRCQGLKANWFQDLWLKAEILFHAKFTPLAEPNQLIAMMMVAGDEYLKLWVKHNKQWHRSINKYWCSEDGAWRGEPEFAAHMAKVIHERTA